MRAVLKKASSGTRRVFRSIRCKKQAFPVRKRYSVHKTGFCGTRRISKARRTADSTDCGQPPAALDAFQRRAVPKAAPAHRTHFRGAPCQKQLLPTGRIFRGPRCMKTPSCHTGRISEAYRAKSSTCPQDTSSVRETAPTLFVRSGPFHHFLRPANAALVSGGPFPCPFDGIRYRKRPPLKDAQNSPRSEVSRHKKGAPRKERTSIKLYDLIISPEIWRPARLQDVR